MKKILLGIMMLFMCIAVNASTGDDVKNIKIEDVKIEVQENIGYNEKLEINYTINPRDAKNLELTWSIVGTKKGITAEFENATTNTSDGTLILTINNTTDKAVTLTINAKQNNKTYVSQKITVETKNTTIERVKEEVSSLINSLDEEITKSNYETNKESIDKITELLTNNTEVKELLDDEQLVKYNDVSETVANYKENNTVVTVVSIVLIIIFSLLIFWIFKKEEK